MQLYSQRRKTAYRALQRLFLRFDLFHSPQYQTGKSGYNAACATLDSIPATGRPAPIPDTSATPDAAQVSTDAYYNRVYNGAGVRRLLWIHARRCSIPQTMIARRGLLLSCLDRWQALHPAHLLRGQRLHLYRVSPAGSRRFPCPATGGLAPGRR